MYNYLYLFYANHEFIWITPTLIHYHMDHSSHFPLLQQWETWLPPSTIHLLDCSIPVQMDSSVWIIVNLYPVGDDLSTRVVFQGVWKTVFWMALSLASINNSVTKEEGKDWLEKTMVSTIECTEVADQGREKLIWFWILAVSFFEKVSYFLLQMAAFWHNAHFLPLPQHEFCLASASIAISHHQKK